MSKSDDLQVLMQSIQVGFSTFYNQVLTPHNVSLAQFAVLLCLAQVSPRKMGDVARALKISLPAVTHLVDRLEEKKMITRGSDPKDRRVSLLQLTTQGKKIVAKTQGRTLTIITQAYRGRSKQEKAAILNFMQQLRKGIYVAMESRA